MNELERFLNELDRLIYAEKEAEPLQKLEGDVYAKADELLASMNAAVKDLANGGQVDELQIMLRRLKELRNRTWVLKSIRYKKICEAARLRPNSDKIRAHLVSWERELYDVLSVVVEKNLGGVGNV